MKFLNLTLVIIFFICTAESCSNKNKVEPQNPVANKLSNASRKDDYNIDINYDANGNPILIKETSDYRNHIYKIAYEGEKIKSVILENLNPNSSTKVLNYEIKYISENEIYIPSPPEGDREFKLTFNENGLLKKSIENVTNYFGKYQYIYDYTYNSDNNLILEETTYSDGIKAKSRSYDDYDQMNNPFFAKAKIWSIINSINLVHLRTYMPFPISRNNPKILTLRDYDAGNKLVYKYDKNNFPIEIQEYVYKKGTPDPPKDSDYYLQEENIKLSY